MKPDVLVAHGPEGPAVVKDFAGRNAFVRVCFGRWVTRRELRAYRVLAGHPAVPRLLGSIDGLAFAVEYRPGEQVSDALRRGVAPGFLGELRAAVEEMHRAGVAHLDLRHRSNVLVGRDGKPVLIDFASAVCFRPGGVAARIVLPWLARIDSSALRKWESRATGR